MLAYYSKKYKRKREFKINLSGEKNINILLILKYGMQ